jgi:hypothetical protein
MNSAKKNLTTVVFHQIYLLILQTKQTNKQTNKHYYIQNHKMTIRLQSMYDDYKHLQLQRNCKFL